MYNCSSLYTKPHINNSILTDTKDINRDSVLFFMGVGKMRNCGMWNAESKMRNGPCGMHLIG